MHNCFTHDLYGDMVQSGIAKKIATTLGLPTPVPLTRYQADSPLLDGQILARFSPTNSAIKDAVLQFLSNHNAHLSTDAYTIAYAQNYQGTLADSAQTTVDAYSRFTGVIFDASDFERLQDLDALYEFFAPIGKKITGRVLILAPIKAATAMAEIARHAIIGFSKSLAKELNNGSTVNVLFVKTTLVPFMESTLGFLLSAKSAYVSGQIITLDNHNVALEHSNSSTTYPPFRPLHGRKILVTGASRGIGASISHTLARDGATVIGVDLPSEFAKLQRIADTIGAKALSLDISSPDAANHLLQVTGTLDGIVHNAGITEDNTLDKMDKAHWQTVINVNLASVYRITQYLLDNNGLSSDARIACLSSIAGLAGGIGQTNYATSKAGIIGLTQLFAKQFAGGGRTINAIAPGFIETAMTKKLPLALREAGRRMNALSQGGLPIDVAETVAWLQDPNSFAINGQCVRVCGLSMAGS